ncbi:MAG: undecaprenyl/decaprenyl-phosphate alpha-N-acetylglucosaminyl 1-phosphate transferase [Candidatus Omnitrophica bacterium]|nr:undecaprenyl/decaprenyl-phosphate alpha-N-acetylglucosaminyl 1-phosphate transferase [Candidatus Omnitrophota bacterium]
MISIYKIYIYLFIWSMLTGFFFISVFKKLSRRFSRLLSKGIPVVGGMSITLTFIITLILGFSLFDKLNKDIWVIIFASLFMLFTGIYDDLRELTIFNKFLVQIIATSILIIFKIRTQIVGIGGTINLLITFLWVIGITNAFNHLDIVDGLSGGVGFLIVISFLIISILNNEPKAIIITLSLLGTLLSFLVYNLPPARIYLGNCGSHFLGFILAILAILISYASLDRKFALLSPIFILGFPIYDTSFLIVMRLKNKRSIFKKSEDHLILRLLNQGYTLKKAVGYLFLFTLFFCVCGILISQLSGWLSGAVVIFSIIIVSVFTIKILKTSNV